MIETEKNKLYTGITTNVERRMKEHIGVSEGSSKLGAKYFRSDKPLRVVYTERLSNRSLASIREGEIKKMKASSKRKLAGLPSFSDR